MKFDMDKLRRECLEWIASIRDDSKSDSGRYRYNRHMLRPYGTEPTAHVVCILHILKALDDYYDKDNIVNFLLDQQEPDTGYFKDSLLNDDELAYKVNAHSWQHIWDHHTYGVLIALLLCGCKPRYPLPEKSHVDLDDVDPAQWVKSLDWTKPYSEGEHFLTTVIACHRKHNLAPGQSNIAQLDAAFAAVESFIDPKSGLPIKNVKDDLSGQGLGGIFKLLLAYAPCGREYPYKENAVNSILGTQLKCGAFVDDNMCMNWDAVIALRILTKDMQDTKCRDRILDSCIKMANRLLTVYRKEDGGFSFNHHHCLTNHNSIRVSAYYPESDVLGTTMCLDSIFIVDAWCKKMKSESFMDVMLNL